VGLYNPRLVINAALYLSLSLILMLLNPYLRSILAKVLKWVILSCSLEIRGKG
jgi:hypothetical protein